MACRSAAPSTAARPWRPRRTAGSRGIPVAVFGVILSVILLAAALGWWRTGDRRLLAIHYGLSLVGVTFEGYFTYLQVFVIEAVCVWCATYGISLILRFLIALVVWLRRDKAEPGAGW